MYPGNTIFFLSFMSNPPSEQKILYNVTENATQEFVEQPKWKLLTSFYYQIPSHSKQDTVLGTEVHILDGSGKQVMNNSHRLLKKERSFT